MQKIIRFSIK